MSSYWDPLADVLPQHVLDAMGKACMDATHHGKGREGESALLAGVRGLLKYVELREVADARIAESKRQFQVFAKADADKAQRVSDNLHQQMADEHNTLARVWQLYMDSRGRKTLSREDLHRALSPGEYEKEGPL